MSIFFKKADCFEAAPDRTKGKGEGGLTRVAPSIEENVHVRLSVRELVPTTEIKNGGRAQTADPPCVHAPKRDSQPSILL